MIFTEKFKNIYNGIFNQRFETYEPFRLYVDDFEGLQRTKYQFPSDRGQMLTGYLYSAGENQRGIVIMAHGFGGGGHNPYMDCANYFAQNGYYVFAYDGTGTDESEGDGTGGFPQGVIDLNHAVDFVKENGEIPDLPIVLFGHSWGGYSVCNVIAYHPEIKAIVECSGFNRSSDLIEAEGKKHVGNAVYLMLLFVKLHESRKFGKYASNTAMGGFAASDAGVMVVHSSTDNVVPMKYGYDIYYKKYKDDSRFRFVRIEDREHNYVYNDVTYVNKFNADLEKWIETLGYDHTASENSERFAADKADYIRQNLNREKWCNMLDTELFAEFVEFYDAYLE